jgi:hypothetical protein
MSKKRTSDEIGDAEQNSPVEPVELQNQRFDDEKTDAGTSGQRRFVQTSSARPSTEISTPAQPDVDANKTGVPELKMNGNETITAADTVTHVIPVKVGLSIIVVFFGKSALYHP